MDLPSGTPSDADLKHTVQDILRTADLNTDMEREICHQLEEHFGMDLTARKATINAAIDHTLLGQSWCAHFHLFRLYLMDYRHYGCTLACGPSCLYSVLTTLARGSTLLMYQQDTPRFAPVCSIASVMV